MSDSTTIPEVYLAKELGVSRDVLAELRKKMAGGGADYATVRNAIVYTPAGVEKIRAALAAPASSDAPAGASQAQGEALAKKEGEPQTLIVKRAARHNPRMIFATVKPAEPAEKKEEAPAVPEEVPVRVRDARCFVPGQEIQAICEGAVWRLAGRQPKRRGRGWGKGHVMRRNLPS